MNPCNEHLQGKMYGLNGIPCDSLGHKTTFMLRLCLLFVSLLSFILFWGGGFKGRGQTANTKGWGDEWDQDTRCEIHNQYKVYFEEKARACEMNISRKQNNNIGVCQQDFI